MDGLEFRPEPLPESLPLRQTRPRPRSDVNGHLNQEGWPVAVHRQSVEPDRQVAAVAGAECRSLLTAAQWVGAAARRADMVLREFSLCAHFEQFPNCNKNSEPVELLDSGGT